MTEENREKIARELFQEKFGRVPGLEKYIDQLESTLAEREKELAEFNEIAKKNGILSPKEFVLYLDKKIAAARRKGAITMMKLLPTLKLNNIELCSDFVMKCWEAEDLALLETKTTEKGKEKKI